MRGIERFGIVLVSLLLAATPPAKAQENIRIGVLLPLTGPLAKNGLENWEAMQIARDMMNERGGINGRKIEYLQGDANTPNAAISETERLITKDGIKITTGSFASPIAIAVSQAAERHGVFHWEATGAAEIITRRGFKHTFQVGAPARKYGQAAVDFIINDLAKRLNKPVDGLKIALLWENRAFGKSVGDGIRTYTQGKGIKLAYDEGYDQTATDMTPIVQKLKDVAPDIVIAISFPNDANVVPAQGEGAGFQRCGFYRRQRRLFVARLARGDRQFRERHLRCRFPAEGECGGADARGKKGRRRVLQALRSQDETAAGWTCGRRVFSDLGAVHRRFAKSQNL